MKKNRKRNILILAACALILLAAAFYCGLVVRRYTVETDKFAGRVRVAVLSDLHSEQFGKDNRTLLKKVARQQPDLIFLVGDMVDDKNSQDGAWALFSQIAAIAPTYYVTGNHEYWSRDIEHIRRQIASYGVVILSDETVRVSVQGVPLVLGGLEDPARSMYEDPSCNTRTAWPAACSGIGECEDFTILLAHRNHWVAEYLPLGFDLVVSGHAHGGQVRIPGLVNGLYAPSTGFFPENAGGKYVFGSMTQVVSRGLKRYGPPRIFNPPEVVVVDVVGR